MNYQYVMGGQLLESVNEVRDLGVQFTTDLKPSRQCQLAYTTASRVLGMIGRTISYKNREVMLRLYKSLVRPHLEFCVSAWSPYYSKDKYLLERIQHRFTRMIPGLKQLPYDKRLESLDLWSLEERRNRADVLEVFRMYKGWSVITLDSMFTVDTNFKTKGHSAKIVKHRCRLEVRRRFFSERVIDRWNSLQQKDIDCTTIVAFKKCLNRTRLTTIGFFTD